MRAAQVITLDGCKLACASVNVRQAGGTVAREYDVLDFYRRHQELKPQGIAELNEGGLALARALAQDVAEDCDALTRKEPTTMPNLPQRKVGIVACSGEELAEGTVTRLAALKVLEELRPAQTVTICLPLFLAGGEGDRAFAKFYPTIAVDGCEKRCAARATELYSNKPAASLLVGEVLARAWPAAAPGRAPADAGEPRRRGRVGGGDRGRGRSSDRRPLEPHRGRDPRRDRDCAGRQHQRLRLRLGHPRHHRRRRRADDPDHGARTDPGVGATARGCAPGGDLPEQIMATVRVYNEIPAGEEARWAQAIDLAWRAFCDDKAVPASQRLGVVLMANTATYTTEVAWKGEHWATS